MREFDIAKLLLRINAVFLKPNDPFTWASGIKSPIYCDTRLVLGYPPIRERIESELANLILEKFVDVEVIVGTSTGGIPHAAYVSDLLKLPMSYVRAKAKDHGRHSLIEGALVDGKNVVVIEDLISTAGSVLDVVRTLKDANACVMGIASIFTYELKKGIENLQAEEITNYSLSNINALVRVALESKYIDDNGYRKINKFIKDPSDDTWME